MFDRLYIVHLPNKARRAAMDDQLAQLGLEATYLHARPAAVGFNNFRRNPRAEFGCGTSHAKCVLRALADGAERPLIIEDDVVFLPGALERLARSAQELPEDWDIVYLGGHPRADVTRHSASLVKVGPFSFAEAYILARKALRPLLDYWLDRVGQPDAMFDFVLGEFAAANRGFCVHPTITEQAVGPSQIGGPKDNKAPLVARAWAKHLAA